MGASFEAEGSWRLKVRLAAAAGGEGADLAQVQRDGG